MSGGFLSRAFGLGRQLLLRGFGGVSDAPPAVTPVPGCLHLTVEPTATMTLAVESASMALAVEPTATMTLTVETC